MNENICYIDGCERKIKIFKRKLCGYHYLRFREWGDPLYVPPKVPRVIPSCKIQECERPAHYRTLGVCFLHYGRLQRGSDLNAPPRMQIRGSLDERIDAWVNKTETCWLWTGHLNNHGYGKMLIAGKTLFVHRVVYEHFVASIPKGLFLDHLCRNPPCCNPEHLEPVTPLENVRRGMGNGSQTHCPKGHPYEGENLRINGGRRYCKACQRINRVAYNQRHGL